MTPEEAVEQLRDRLTTGRLKTVKLLIEECVATAKATETRRCAARVKIWLSRQRRLTEPQRLIYRELSNEILITGGLEAEE